MQELMHILRAEYHLLAEGHCRELDLPILKLLETKAVGSEDLLLLPAQDYDRLGQSV